MYLHLGRDVSVRTTDILGIFDLDTSSYAKRTKDFLTRMEKAGRAVNISEDLPKSFVLCEKDGTTTLYISQISSATLLKRAGQGLLSAEGSAPERNGKF